MAAASSNAVCAYVGKFLSSCRSLIAALMVAASSTKSNATAAVSPYTMADTCTPSSQMCAAIASIKSVLNRLTTLPDAGSHCAALKAESRPSIKRITSARTSVHGVVVGVLVTVVVCVVVTVVVWVVVSQDVSAATNEPAKLGHTPFWFATTPNAVLDDATRPSVK